MSIFDVLRRKKKKQEEAESKTSEAMDIGIEQAVRKKKAEQIRNPEKIVLDGYIPNLPIEEAIELKEENISIRTKEECLQSLEENCEQILEADRHTENAKIEYQAVTEYMSDVQKIERMEAGERKLLNDTANRLVQLNKEKENYQNREIVTSNQCFRAIRKNEGFMMEELKNMREQEDYRKKVQNDLRQLEAEKAALTYDYDRIPAKQKELKHLAIAMGAIVISLFVLFAVLMEGLKTSMTIPFMMTVLMAAGAGAYIFYEAYRNRYDYEVLQKKINRSIKLLNKVKIKYINNTSSLDYSYSKYHVKNSMELEYLMKEYSKAKEAERSYESNADRYSHYREKLLDLLEFHEIKDCKIWMHQLSVLLNENEFEEMKQGLESRRLRLVEKMDYNAKVRDQSFEQMHQILEEKPELKNELLAMMNKYKITL